MAKGIWRYNGSGWEQGKKAWRFTNGTWQEAKKAYVLEGGNWVERWSSSYRLTKGQDTQGSHGFVLGAYGALEPGDLNGNVIGSITINFYIPTFAGLAFLNGARPFNSINITFNDKTFNVPAADIAGQTLYIFGSIPEAGDLSYALMNTPVGGVIELQIYPA
ncbi:hypothetical protein [Chromobacterium amazonense]|uniref:hypothetical protein n=1 Tax=Chromobacterium amazonense TaxID=1382803 RepID=UPI0011B22A35|nr:hypothetical protein [Chromobacterium amazonense]